MKKIAKFNRRHCLPMIPVFLMAGIIATALSAANPGTDNPVVQLNLLGDTYRIELVDTPQRRMIGLMHRETLDPDHGMLFLYPRSSDHRIWMKNTLIPLTVIWLDDEARILRVANLSPCKQSNCPSFGAGASTRYVLELHPAAYSRFKPGDRLPALLEYRAGDQARGAPLGADNLMPARISGSRKAFPSARSCRNLINQNDHDKNTT